MAPPKIYHSPLPDLPMPSTSIFSFLFEGENFDKYPPSKPAYIDAITGNSLNRGEVKELALRIAFGLKNVLKKKRGDTILIFSPNSLIYPPLIFGSVAAGLKTTFANAAYMAKELAHQFTNSGASTIFVHPALLPIALETLKLVGVTTPDALRRSIVVMGFADEPELRQLKGKWTTLPEVYSAGKLDKAERFDGSASKETVYLCYSSGTTGLPKGVETMHTNITAVLTLCKVQLRESFAPDRANILLGILPFSHIFGLTVTLHHVFYEGCPLVFLQRFDPILFMSSIAKYKATMAFIAPPILVILNIHPDLEKHDMSSLISLGSGAAPLPESLVLSVAARFKKAYGTDLVIGNGYGLTETSPGSHTLSYSMSMKKIGSVGTLFPNCQARLIGDDGEDVKEGEDGELWLRGPVVMKGYHANEEATKATLTPDGWLKTGDYGHVDSEGYWYISGRKKELIKYNGFQVSPPELESVLLENLEVADVGVIGVYDESMATELPRAYVVPRAGLDSIKDPAAREKFCKGVQKYVEQRVAKHKYLRGGVYPIEAIPKNPSGKILRRELVLLAEKEKQTKSKL